jgi:hypothetical protein
VSLEQHRIEPRAGKAAVEPLRQRTGFEANTRVTAAELDQSTRDYFRITRRLCFPDQLAGRIDNADAALIE